MKNVLFLLGAYEPAPSANGICALMIIEKMKSLGINVSCVANMYQKREKEETIDGVKIRRIDNQLYLQLQEKAKLQKSAIKRFLFSSASVCTDIGRLIIYKNKFPIMSPIRATSYFQEAERLVKEKCIDTVIAINIPIEAIEATMMLKDKYKDLHCIAYLLDPIYGGIHHRFLSEKEELERAQKYEKKVLCCFDKVIVQKEHQSHYTATYTSDELRKVEYLGVPLLSNKIKGRVARKDNFVAIFAGGVSEKTRNPRYIIEVFKRISNARLKMFITNEHGFVNGYVNGCNNIEIFGRIPHDKLEEEFANADCLVNIGNNQTMQAPSKLIEYMSYGKPIVSTYRISSDTSKEYMDRYPMSIYLDENNSNYDQAAMAIRELVMNESNIISFEELEEIFGEYTPDAFLKAINLTM